MGDLRSGGVAGVALLYEDVSWRLFQRLAERWNRRVGRARVEDRPSDRLDVSWPHDLGAPHGAAGSHADRLPRHDDLSDEAVELVQHRAILLHVDVDGCWRDRRIGLAVPDVDERMEEAGRGLDHFAERAVLVEVDRDLIRALEVHGDLEAAGGAQAWLGKDDVDVRLKPNRRLGRRGCDGGTA